MHSTSSQIIWDEVLFNYIGGSFYGKGYIEG